jgi:hypothetical protein
MIWQEEDAMKNKEELLNSKDVAHILDIAPDEVIKLAQKGKLKGTKKGRFWIFRLGDVQAYKMKQEKGEITSHLPPAA